MPITAHGPPASRAGPQALVCPLLREPCRPKLEGVPGSPGPLSLTALHLESRSSVHIASCGCKAKSRQGPAGPALRRGSAAFFLQFPPHLSLPFLVAAAWPRIWQLLRGVQDCCLQTPCVLGWTALGCRVPGDRLADPVSNLCANSVLSSSLLRTVHSVGPLGGKPRVCSVSGPGDATLLHVHTHVAHSVTRSPVQPTHSELTEATCPSDLLLPIRPVGKGLLG